MLGDTHRALCLILEIVLISLWRIDLINDSNLLEEICTSLLLCDRPLKEQNLGTL